MLHHRVDDREMHGRKFFCHRLHRNPLVEPDTDDQIAAALSEAAMRLLELGVVGDLELDRSDPGFLLEAFGAIGHTFVEGFVELAASIEDDSGFGISRLNESCRQQYRSECDGGPRDQHYGLLSEWPICASTIPHTQFARKLIALSARAVPCSFDREENMKIYLAGPLFSTAERNFNNDL